jgi:hypothetical protein
MTRVNAQVAIAGAVVLALAVFSVPAPAADTYTNALMGLSGLVSYWNLNELPGAATAIDAVSSDPVDAYNPGVYSGGGITVGDAGPRPADGWAGFSADNRAVTFSKLPDAQLQMDNVAGYAGLTDATLLGWVRVTDPNAASLVNSFGGLQTAGFPRVVLGADFAPTGLRGFARRADDDQLLLGPTTASNLSNWHFLAVSYEGGATGHLYWDGVEVAAKVAPAARGLDAASAMVFGRDVGDPTRGLGGQLDELATFNRALSAAEIQTLWLAAKNQLPHVPEPDAPYFQTAVALGGLRNHWRFSETGGTTAADVIGGNNGTFVNVAGAPVALGQPGPTPSEGQGGYPFNGFPSDNTSVRFVWNTGANYMQIAGGQVVGNPTTGLKFTDGISQLTMAMWVKRTYAGDGYLGGFSRSGSSNRYVFSVYAPNATDLRFYALASNGVQMQSGDLTVDTAGDYQWHHLVQVWDGTEKRLRVYIDGVERFNATDATMGVNLYVPGGFHLGRDFYGSTRNLGGFLDEVSLFDRALSEADVLKLYDSAFYEAPIPGDATGDGVVNQADAAQLAANWGVTGADWEMGDFNGDGVVGPGDASILAANWGTVGESGRSVPEPSACAALIGALAALALQCGRTRGGRSGREH